MDKKKQEIRINREIKEKGEFLYYRTLSLVEKEIVTRVEHGIVLDTYQNALLQEAYNRERTKDTSRAIRHRNYVGRSYLPKSKRKKLENTIQIPCNLSELVSLQKSLKRLKKKQEERFNAQRYDFISHLEFCIHHSPNFPNEQLTEFKYKKNDKKKVNSRAKQSAIQPISRDAKEKFAEMLLRRMTSAEKAVLPELNQLGFLPQRIVLGFIPDFWLPAKKVIVEIDGGYHTEEWKIKEDQVRDEIFRRNGYTVLRFTNDQVSNDRMMVVEQIKKVVSV